MAVADRLAADFEPAVVVVGGGGCAAMTTTPAVTLVSNVSDAASEVIGKAPKLDDGCCWEGSISVVAMGLGRVLVENAELLKSRPRQATGSGFRSTPSRQEVGTVCKTIQKTISLAVHHSIPNSLHRWMDEIIYVNLSSSTHQLMRSTVNVSYQRFSMLTTSSKHSNNPPGT